MKFSLTESMGPVWMGRSKHGELVRGLVREDGRMFWAYDKDGREQWLTPLRFKEYKEMDARAKERFGGDKAVQVVQRRRKNNPEHAKALSRKQKDEKVSGTTMKRVQRGFSVLMRVLEERHEYNTGGVRHLRLPVSKTDARALRAYLSYVTRP